MNKYIIASVLTAVQSSVQGTFSAVDVANINSQFIFGNFTKKKGKDNTFFIYFYS